MHAAPESMEVPASTTPAREYDSSMSATYSPEDNKLRLYSVHRLADDVYHRLANVGFKRAPKQDLYFAPAWTPAREDVLMDLCGEIGDEDRTMMDRAEERSDRFEGYKESRESDYRAAREQVASITEHIPFGQPILVGHHSERRARKDQERIQRATERAVNMWDTAEYWQRRARSAVLHAEYKERPDVRYRRIKTIEADKRKAERIISEAQKFNELWMADGLTLQKALGIANFDHVSKCFSLEEYPRSAEASQYEGMMSLWSALSDAIITAEQAREIAVRVHNRTIAHHSRWLAHYENRIAYEKAMLGESGGLAADKFNIEVGGQVLVRGEWCTVLRITKKDGRISSVRTNARFVPARSIEEVDDYRAPSKEQAEAAKAATKLAPLVNFPGEGFVVMTKAEYGEIHKDYRTTRRAKANDEHGAYRYRIRFTGGKLMQVYLSDAKRVDPPAPDVVSAAPLPPVVREERSPGVTHQVEPDAARNEVEGMRKTLAQGVQVVVAPQLFESSPVLADRVVQEADIRAGHDVLEPNGGTGRIINAIFERVDGVNVDTVEINAQLCEHLKAKFPQVRVTHADFLEWDDGRRYDRIVMNPPFANGADIKHIKHALYLLKPGGILVAICAAGPRQQDALIPLTLGGGFWEPLPEGSFSHAGTNVRAALVVIYK
ncbi:methyltransferase type 11 [Pandoraea cepalis]|uniref:Methyltransferase type 11 n=1 Tax=Pandoraea cepalis TaxID=2508294 RepID=A0AAW7MH51_9BURK|nr:DUF3560 domain-containing protein [Pandoraea cepalis]MDN4572058.1 methyltransferase type 11 [Pandoraea cepalis]MDN4578904.1 methyltransferase type 11 [Pandoraea cepalis]